MGTFEYLLLFAAVILGLAISDLAISLHRLLNAAGRVRWDWLSPMAAALAFVRIVTQWWTWHDAERIAGGLTFGMFLGILISATLLFLMAAVALPDEFRGRSRPPGVLRQCLPPLLAVVRGSMGGVERRLDLGPDIHLESPFRHGLTALSDPARGPDPGLRPQSGRAGRRYRRLSRAVSRDLLRANAELSPSAVRPPHPSSA
jgi:hypothetical protein